MAKLTSLALVITPENGELVNCRAVIVACVFVMFVSVAFCRLPFFPVRVPMKNRLMCCGGQMCCIVVQVLQGDLA